MFLLDDNFLTNRKRIEELCEEIERRKIKKYLLTQGRTRLHRRVPGPDAAPAGLRPDDGALRLRDQRRRRAGRPAQEEHVREEPQGRGDPAGAGDPLHRHLHGAPRVRGEGLRRALPHHQRDGDRAAAGHHPHPAAGHRAVPEAGATSSSPGTPASSTSCTRCCPRRSRARRFYEKFCEYNAVTWPSKQWAFTTAIKRRPRLFLDSLPGALRFRRRAIKYRPVFESPETPLRDELGIIPARRDRPGGPRGRWSCRSCGRCARERRPRVPRRAAPGGGEPPRREPPAALPPLPGPVHPRGLPGDGPPALPAGGHVHDLPRAPPPPRPRLGRQAVDRQGAGGRIRRGLGRQGPRGAVPRVPRGLRGPPRAGAGHAAASRGHRLHRGAPPHRHRGAVPGRAWAPWAPATSGASPRCSCPSSRGWCARASARRSASTSTCTAPRTWTTAAGSRRRWSASATTRRRRSTCGRGALLSLEARARFWSGVQDRIVRWRQPRNMHLRPQARRGMDGRDPDSTLRQFREMRSVRGKGRVA